MLPSTAEEVCWIAFETSGITSKTVSSIVALRTWLRTHQNVHPFSWKLSSYGTSFSYLRWIFHFLPLIILSLLSVHRLFNDTLFTWIVHGIFDSLSMSGLILSHKWNLRKFFSIGSTNAIKFRCTILPKHKIVWFLNCTFPKSIFLLLQQNWGFVGTPTVLLRSSFNCSSCTRISIIKSSCHMLNQTTVLVPQGVSNLSCGVNC